MKLDSIGRNRYFAFNIWRNEFRTRVPFMVREEEEGAGCSLECID
ncbi:MAG TPA: hypothetical protein VMX58_05100 [Patescibacteria group bacterium]|nr:hypothetical protein [Patescibacteria group bacterium]